MQTYHFKKVVDDDGSILLSGLLPEKEVEVFVSYPETVDLQINQEKNIKQEVVKTLTLKISESLYKHLLATSMQVEQPPENLILGWLEHRIKIMKEDPLLQLAGIFEAPITDIAERHDDYIGENLHG